MSEIYKVFSRDWQHCCDYSDESLLEMFHSETHGDPVSPTNGFYIGKKWLNVSVKMWKEDMEKGLLFPGELYNDPQYPHWWLNSVLGESK